METIVENSGDSIGYLGLTQSTGRIIVIDQASRFRAMKRQFEKLQAEREAMTNQKEASSDFVEYLNIEEDAGPHFNELQSEEIKVTGK